MIPDQPAPAFPAAPSATDIRGPSALNPHAVWPVAITIVTTDPAASGAFYGRHCGYEDAGAGELRRDGAPNLRLVAAPKGASPNRGRKGETPVDPGFAALRCMTGDIAATRARLVADGITVHGDPGYYAFGPPQRPWASGLMLAADGPDGERILFDQPYRADALRQSPTGVDERVMAVTPVLFGFDRWPWIDGMETALGLRLWVDRYAGQSALARAAGMAEGGQFRILALSGLEYWEFRSFRPPATSPWPTSLDRTGLALLTIACVDPAGARARLTATGVPIIDAAAGGGFRFRGAVGELIEIVGRDR